MYKFKKVGIVNSLPQIKDTFTEININDLSVIEKMILVNCLNDYSIHAETMVLREEILSKLI